MFWSLCEKRPFPHPTFKADENDTLAIQAKEGNNDTRLQPRLNESNDVFWKSGTHLRKRGAGKKKPNSFTLWSAPACCVTRQQIILAVKSWGKCEKMPLLHCFTAPLRWWLVENEQFFMFSLSRMCLEMLLPVGIIFFPQDVEKNNPHDMTQSVSASHCFLGRAPAISTYIHD